MIQACCEGSLVESEVIWEENLFAVGVILASRGYPVSSSKGQVIIGVDDISCETNQFVFHSGTSISSEGELLTNGIFCWTVSGCVNSYIDIYTSSVIFVCLFIY